jgi:asparagine synthase (glutamine-hydrolysing)
VIGADGSRRDRVYWKPDYVRDPDKADRTASGEEGDEFRYSDLIIEKYGTRHHRMRIDSGELVPAIEDTLGAMTEPMGTQDVTGFYLLSRTVSEHIKVVQSGQCADEVFTGYAYHQPAGAVPREAALDAFEGAFLDRTHRQIADIVGPEWYAATDVSRALLEAHLDAPGAETALDAVLRLDTHLLLVDDPVKRVDSMLLPPGL